MFKKFLLSLAGLLFIALPVVVPSVVLADAKTDVCAGVQAASGNECSGGSTTVAGAISTTLRILQLLAGVLAIFYLIYAGLKFITSSGSSDGVKSAKNTILYAAIGLVVVIVSQFIIQFVLSRFDKP
jgi:hypothetical protein